MLHSVKLMTGASIVASDGAMGCVSNFFFDDLTRALRYLREPVSKGFAPLWNRDCQSN